MGGTLRLTKRHTNDFSGSPGRDAGWIPAGLPKDLRQFLALIEYYQVF